MNLSYVSLDQFMGNKFDSSTCDILIMFLPQPDTQSITDSEPVGTTQFGTGNNRALIKIYYLQLDFQRNVEETHDQNYVYHTYTWTPVYLNQIATDAQMSMAIRHELGHAFGLGHYVISDQEMQEWLNGVSEPTSIMVKAVMPIGYTHFDITPIDVQELKSLYGNNGFGGIPQPSLPVPVPIPIPRPTPSLPSDVQKNNVIISRGASSGQDCVTANNCFDPPNVQVPVGYTVTWGNDDTDSHTVTSGNPSDNITGSIFYSGLIKAGSTFAFKFTNAGTFNYYCQVHPWMKGQIIVGSGSSPITPTTQISSMTEYKEKFKNTKGNVSNQDFENVVNYLKNRGLLSLPATTGNVSMPHWFKNNIMNWAQNIITDKEFADGIKFLADKGIIKI